MAALSTGGLIRAGGGPASAAERGGETTQTAAEQRPAEEAKSSEETTRRVQPLVIARPGELDEKSMSGAYRFFLGTTHAHSGYSGDHAKTVATKLNHGEADYDRHTPLEIFEKARANGFDFYFMTDHSSPEQNEFYKNGFTDEHWAATRKQAEQASTANFLALRGFEFSRNSDPEKGGLGHMNILNTDDWASAYAKGHTFEWAYDWLAAQRDDLVAAQFNHPQMPGKARTKNFNDYRGRTRARNEVVCLAEIWNSGDNMGYVPVVRKIWALGWKVAPTAGTDVHGLFGIENRTIRTGVLAERLDTESIMRALRARRVYATLEPRMHVEFTLNGFMMGSALESRPDGDLKAKVFVNDPAGSVLSRVDIHGANYDTNGGASKVVASLPVPQGGGIVEGNVPGGYDFYYAAVFKQGVETARAFTAPIWMDDH
jgi:trimeric autotransporter adhesin